MEQKNITPIEKVRKIIPYLFKLSKRDLERRLKDEKITLSPLAIFVLRQLEKESCTIAVISDKMTLSAATLVPVIDSLEKIKMIHRKKDPVDRRMTNLLITEKGREIVKNTNTIIKENKMAKCLSILGEKKVKMLASLLEDLAEEMTEGDNKKEAVLRIYRL